MRRPEGIITEPNCVCKLNMWPKTNLWFQRFDEILKAHIKVTLRGILANFQANRKH